MEYGIGLSTHKTDEKGEPIPAAIEVKVAFSNEQLEKIVREFVNGIEAKIYRMKADGEPSLIFRIEISEIDGKA